MASIVLSTTDIKTMGQTAVLVIPVLALSYLVADTEKFKVSTLLRSPIAKRIKEVRDPELYDALPSLIFSIFAIAGFATGLFVIQAPSILVWQSAVLLVAVGICGLIIIFQLFLSIAITPLEHILEHHEKSSKKGIVTFGNVIFFGFTVITALLLIAVFANLIFLLYTYAFNTTIG